MPYIKKKKREILNQWGLTDLVSYISKEKDIEAGDLNYIFTTLCNAYINNKGERYKYYNDILGALEGCKLELYRRKIANYEDKKIKKNGDVTT